MIDQYEDDFDIVTSKMERFPDQLIIYIDLLATSFNEPNIGNKCWKIIIQGKREATIRLERTSYIDLSQSHPLLWKYLDIQCELYFSGQTEFGPHIFTQMFGVHNDLFEDYLPFSCFLNSNKALIEILKSNSGLIAKGPKKLLTQYADILSAYSLNVSIIGDRMPTCWNGDSFKPEPQDLQVLLLGNSYIIGQKFEFQPVQ